MNFGKTDWRFSAAKLCAGCGIAGSLALYFLLGSFESRNARLEMRAAAQERVEILRNKIECSMEVLHSVGALCSSAGDISRARFHEFTVDALARHPEIQALSWDPCVPLDQRAMVEAQAHSDGLPGFSFSELNAEGKLVPADARPDYVPICFVEPLSKNQTALGFDLASDPERSAALRRARNSGLPCATTPLRLVQESGSQLGFLVLRPVYMGADAASDRAGKQLAGFVSAVFRIGDLAGDTFEQRAFPGKICIYDKATRKYAFQQPGSAGPGSALPHPSGALHWTEPLKMAGMDWDIEFLFANGGRGWESFAGLLAGLVITALTTGYIIRGMRHTAEIEMRVQERTAELSREIVVREKIARDLQHAEQKYRSIFENAIEGIFQTAPDGHYLSANPALARIYGYESPAELIAALGDIGRQLYKEPSRRADFIRKVRQQGVVADFESQVWRKDGEMIWISETAREVCGVEGEVLYYEGTVQEITQRKLEHDALEIRVKERTLALARANDALLIEVVERKRAEEAAANASKAKSAFLAHMSHEIRTPLNAILGYAQILQRDAALPEQQHQAIETIATSGNHLFELINEVLDMSKIEAGHMELQQTVFNLTDLIRRLECMFRHRCEQKRLGLCVELPGDGPRWVSGDEGKLRQVLINLIGNSVKFTDQGEVRLKVTPRERSAFEFEVLDTGAGLTAEEQAEIFQPFQQGLRGSEKGGTGLGLAISARYVKLMGGVLETCAAQVKGARFFFTLELPEKVSTARVTAPARRHMRLPEGKEASVVVVDDIRENRQVLAGMLSGIGCSVAMAESGSAAIQLARTLKPDIIFMDIWMPDMNGIDATQHILAAMPGMKIVAHSASAFGHEQDRYLDAGFDDFLAKPFRYERVCDCISNLLDVQLVTEERPPVHPDRGDSLPVLLLPENIRDRVRAAAEMHNITELRLCADEAAALGPEGGKAADILSMLAGRYDMKSILAATCTEAAEFACR